MSLRHWQKTRNIGLSRLIKGTIRNKSENLKVRFDRSDTSNLIFTFIQRFIFPFRNVTKKFWQIIFSSSQVPLSSIYRIFLWNLSSRSYKKLQREHFHYFFLQSFIHIFEHIKVLKSQRSIAKPFEYQIFFTVPTV